jgi:hypothetical protein
MAAAPGVRLRKRPQKKKAKKVPVQQQAFNFESGGSNQIEHERQSAACRTIRARSDAMSPHPGLAGDGCYFG